MTYTSALGKINRGLVELNQIVEKEYTSTNAAAEGRLEECKKQNLITIEQRKSCMGEYADGKSLERIEKIRDGYKAIVQGRDLIERNK